MPWVSAIFNHAMRAMKTLVDLVTWREQTMAMEASIAGGRKGDDGITARPAVFGARMTVSTASAAKFISECSGWTVSHLELQKILYIADVVHLGRTGKRLTDATFEAWDYGPVDPSLYQVLKGYGSKPIPRNAWWATSSLEPSREAETLRDACDHLVGKSASYLIENTHRNGGAWSKRYVPRANVAISDEDMLAEYENRRERADKAA